MKTANAPEVTPQSSVSLIALQCNEIDECLVKIADVRKITTLSTTGIYRLANAGEFPKPRRVRNSSRWVLGEIKAWVRALPEGLDDREAA
jgi:prophage regulatory protein